MKKLFVSLFCLVNCLLLWAQEQKTADYYTTAQFVRIYDTQDEGVVCKTRCLVYVKSDYIIAPATTLRGFYKYGSFIFRVGLDYYALREGTFWDVKSRDPFTLIDDMRENSSEKNQQSTHETNPPINQINNNPSDSIGKQ